MNMDQGLKERLVGAAVLVILAVIFIPMLLGGSPESEQPITETNIPERPAIKSGTHVMPLEMPGGTIAGPDTKEAGEGKPEASGEQAAGQPPATMLEVPEEIATVEKPADVTQTKNVGLTAWVVQLGSFNTRENAEQLNEKLRKAGYPAFVEPLKQGNTTTYRVRVGPELLRSDAEAMLAKLKSSMDLNGFVRQYP